MRSLSSEADARARIVMVHDRARMLRGSDVAFAEQRQALREAGYDVRSFTFDPEGGGDRRDVVYREHPRPLLRKAWRYAFNPRVYRRLRRFACRVRPHLIVLNTYYNYPLSVLAACRGWRILAVHQSAPLVCPNLSLRHARTGRSCEGWFGWQCLREGCVSAPAWPALVGLYTVWPALSRRWIARHAAVSRPLADALKRRGMRGVSVLPLYVDTAQLKPAPYPAGDARVLYVGHLSRDKGVLDLMRAFGAVHRQHPRAHLELVGTGPARDELERLAAELGVRPAVTFAGQVPHERIAEPMARSAVVVMPSVGYEGFGLVGVEAMSAARPVVGTRVGGIPDWLTDGETGFLVPARDVPALAEGISWLLDHPAAAAAMGRRGRGRAERDFDVSVFRRRFLALIGEQ